MNEAIETWLQINSSVFAKDRLYRFVQYGSRLITAKLVILSPILTPKQQFDLSLRLRSLSNAISLCRKFYRVGKWIEQLQSAKKALKMHNELERSMAFTKAIGLVIWLFLDTIQWLNRNKIITINPVAMFFVDKTASTAWLVSVIASIVLSGYRLNGALERDAKSAESVTHGTDLIISLCDLFLPLSLLGYVQNETFVGFCGTLSSYLGLKNYFRSKNRFQ